MMLFKEAVERAGATDRHKVADVLRTIEFERIAGGKAFDTSVDWFQTVLKRTGQG